MLKTHLTETRKDKRWYQQRQNSQFAEGSARWKCHGTWAYHGYSFLVKADMYSQYAIGWECVCIDRYKDHVVVTIPVYVRAVFCACRARRGNCPTATIPSPVSNHDGPRPKCHSNG
eukprot:scaffold482_cov266-Amphora_coffeaeformis.AAC.50